MRLVFNRRAGPGQKGGNVTRFRNYWAYSFGLAVAWAVVLTLRVIIGGAGSMQPS